jgi:hypothetical protein
MAQIDKVRLPNGNVVIPGEWTMAVPLYSTVEIAAGSFNSGIIAFSYGQGGVVPGSVGPRQSTIIDTNLQGEGGKLPENEQITIRAIGVEVTKIGPAASVDRFPDCDPPGVPLPDMLRIQRDLVMQFVIAGVKQYTNSPLSYWPSGTGIFYTISGGRSQVSGAGGNGEVPANNGYPATEATRELASPLQIAGGEAFGIVFLPGPGQVTNLNLATNSRIRLRTYLDGERRRPVA